MPARKQMIAGVLSAKWIREVIAEEMAAKVDELGPLWRGSAQQFADAVGFPGDADRFAMDLRDRVLDLDEDGQTWVVLANARRPKNLTLDLRPDLAPFIAAWNKAATNRVGRARTSGLQTSTRDQVWARCIATYSEPEEWRFCALALSTSKAGMDWAPSQGHLRWLLESPAKLEKYMAAGRRIRDGEFRPSAPTQRSKGLSGVVDAGMEHLRKGGGR